MASQFDNIVPLHRGARIIGSVDQALIDGAYPLIPPETLARLNGDDEALQAIRERDADAHLQTLRHRLVPDLTWRDDLADLWDDIRSAPLSHAVVAVVTVIIWTALLVLPTLVLS
jgi:hypothetical protein